jgi:hypothetical protein
MFKEALKSVCTSAILVSHDPLSPTPKTASAVKTPDNTEGYPHNPEPEMKEISKWNTPLIS